MWMHIFIAVILSVSSIFGVPIDYSQDDNINYELLGGGFEGDMIFPDGFDPIEMANGRGVAIFGSRQWPNNVVPYDLSLISNAAHRSMIEEAMRILMDVTSAPITGSSARRQCIHFRPKTSSDRVFLKAQYGTGCSASVGYGTGTRSLTLKDSGCFRSGIIQHELLHVLGFYHEQSRPDRDSYITVNYANIEAGKEHNFNKYVWGSTVFNQGTPYDFGSIMHYGATAFGKNGARTITTKQSNASIGQRQRLSATDIAEIRAFYGCSS